MTLQNKLTPTQQLIYLQLDQKNYSANSSQVAKLFPLICQSEKWIKNNNGETFYTIPYEIISDFVYSSELDFNEGDLEDFFSEVTHLMIENSTDKHVLECFRKFKQHILLSYFQTIFIKKTAKDAMKIASEAEKISKRAKKISKKMITNFVTILGIFATIIFTLLGGIQSLTQVISNLTTKELNISKVIFLGSFILFCVATLTLILMLCIKYIVDESAFREKSYNNPLFLIFMIFLIILAIGITSLLILIDPSWLILVFISLTIILFCLFSISSYNHKKDATK